MAKPETFRPLRSPRFRLVFSGQLVSGLGDWLDYVAILSLVAYQWHDGAAGLAAVAVCSALPWIVLSPVAGVVVDRLPKRLVLVCCDLARAAIVLCYLLARSLPLLLVLLVIKMSFSAMFSPASSSTVQQSVERDELLGANALTSLSTQATKVVGPAIGGLLFASVGARGAFLGDSLSFVLSAAILSRLRFDPEARQASSTAGPSRPGWRAEMTAGLRFIVRQRQLLVAVASMALTVFLVFAFDTLMPLAIRGLGLRVAMLGYSIGAVGLGSAAGALLIARMSARLAALRLMCLAQTAAGCLVAVVGLLISIHLPAASATVVLIMVMLGTGFAASGLFIGYPTVLQADTPPELMGRVAALSGAIPTTLQLAAPVLGAAVASAFGVSAVFVVAGLALALIGVTVLVMPVSRVRRVKTRNLEAGHWPDPSPQGLEEEDADVLVHWDTATPVGIAGRLPRLERQLHAGFTLPAS